jgi:trimethylamine--corrinoid protein Co-methyltransferase
MQPKLELLDQELIARILTEAFALLWGPGVKVQAPAALELLASAGARVEGEIVHIPEAVARQALATVPHEFCLYDRQGHPAVHYAGDAVHFDPGSSCTHVLDAETREHRLSQAADLVRLVQVTEMLPQYAAQSTAVVCNDVPQDMGDLYRLFLVLLYSNKPVVTGAFTVRTTQVMIDLLAADSGGRVALKAKPRAVFDVCPSPPLNWSAFATQNLVDLARAWVPAQMVSMPLAGATAPVTLLGAIVQHAAESLSGLTIHQLAQPGAPIVWGGAPAIFDMRWGTTPMGAVETAMITAGYAQIGKHLGLPTHAYLGASDAKIVDAQAGLESGVSAVLGALAGINMISGAGMLDFLACFSVEKLVVDAEAIAMAQRLLQGLQPRTATLATAAFAQVGFQSDFLKLKETRQLFKLEQSLPSPVIDRGSLRAWQEGGCRDTLARAQARLRELLASYQRPELAPAVQRELYAIVEGEARCLGLERLPGVPTRTQINADPR